MDIKKHPNTSDNLNTAARAFKEDCHVKFVWAPPFKYSCRWVTLI